MHHVGVDHSEPGVIESSRRCPHDRKSKLPPERHGGSVGADDEVELHGGEARALRFTKRILAELTALQQKDARIGDIRGRGAMMAIELVDADGKPDAALTQRVAKACHAAGVIVLTCGTDGNVFRLLPPLSITDELLREGLSVIADALAAN